MQNGAPNQLFDASLSAYQAAIEHFGRVLHMLRSSARPGPDGTVGLQAVQQQLVKELETWLSTSHPLTGWMSAALHHPAPGVMAGASLFSRPADGNLPRGAGRAFDPARAPLQAQISQWFRLQSQLAAHWNRIAQDAGRGFARRLGAMAPVADLAEVRKLYDLWVECAEEAYAQTAHSEAFSRLISELINMGLTLRLEALQHFQTWAGAAGLPTRAELEALQRQVAELESHNSQLRKRATANATRGPTKHWLGKSARGNSKSRGASASPHEDKGRSSVKGRSRPRTRAGRSK